MSDDLDAWELTGVLTRLRRVMRASVRGEFPWEALRMAQVEILRRLSEEPGRRVGELAAQHRLAMNTVSNLVQQMVVGGLVERRADETDRRAVTVHLTDEGRERLRKDREARRGDRLHERGVRRKLGGEQAGRVVGVVEPANLLAQQRAEEHRAEARREALAGDSKEGRNDIVADGGAAGEGDLLSGATTLLGGSAADTVVGDSRPNVLDGWAGDDVLTGRGGDDTLRGDLGADRLSGGNGADVLLGGSGADVLLGGDGDDLLRGDAPTDPTGGADRLALLQIFIEQRHGG